jgi:hypothetical protein
MIKSMYEVLKETSQLSDREQQINHLRANYSKAMHFLLLHVFDDRVKFLLPEVDPPYKKNETLEAQGMLYSRARELYLFVADAATGKPVGPPELSQMRREALFISLLESVDPEDAVLLLHIVKKKLPFENITKGLIDSAWGPYKRD